VGAAASLDVARLSRAAVWFPLVGLVVGGAMAGARWAAGLVLPAPAATVLALAAAVAVTGAMHEDGLADTADALGAHTTRERRLEILRDPRLGTFGVLAIAFMVLFPFAVLSGLGAGDFARAAVAAHVLGRWSILPQTRLVGPARADGAGALVRAGSGATVVATVGSAGVALAAGGGWPGLAALGAAAAVTAAGAWCARSVLGGVTGDTLGAVTKLVELAVYASLVACW
jgi:adenosylcobinamide-GDP ribazoletransferase